MTEEQIGSLRRRIRQLVGQDEISNTSVDIDYGDTKLRLMAHVSLPSLQSDTHVVERGLRMTTTAWKLPHDRSNSIREPGPIRWEAERWVRTTRRFALSDLEIRARIDDSVSYADANRLLRCLQKAPRRAPKSQKDLDLSLVSRIDRLSEGRYRLFTNEPRSRWVRRGWAFEVTLRGTTAQVVSARHWVA